jgi:hypothetical protein
VTFDAGSIEATLKLNRDQFERDVAKAKQEGADFDGKTFEAELKVDAAQPKEEAVSTTAMYDALRENLQKAIKLKVDAQGFAEADAEIEITKHEVDSLNKKRLNIGGIFGGGGGFGGLLSAIGGLGGAFSGMSNNISQGNVVWSGLVSAIIGLAPLIVAALTPVIGLAGALTASLAGAGLAVGGIAIAVGPVVSKLIKDYQALTAAQAKLKAATTGTQRTAALRAEADATRNLTGTQKGLFQELLQVVALWHKLQNEFARPVSNALQPWFQVVKTVLGLLPLIVKPALGAFKALGDEFEIVATSPAFHDFLQEMGKFGAFALKEFGLAGVQLANALGQILLAFIPLAQIVLPGIVSLAREFANWASGLSGSAGFNAFIAYVVANGPVLGSLLLSILRIFVNLGIALAPLGAVMLVITAAIAKFLAHLSPNALLAIILGVTALGVALALAFAGVPLIIAAVVGAVVALSALLINMWPAIKRAWISAWHSIYNNFAAPLINFFTKTIPRALDIWKNATFLTADAIELTFLKLVSKIIGIMAKLPGPLGAPFRKAQASIKTTTDAIQADIAKKARNIQHDWDAIHGKKVALTFGLNLPAGVSFPSRPIKGRRARGGGIGASGYYLTGEEGPEITWLPKGSHVMPAGPTKKVLGGLAGGTGDWQYADQFNPSVPTFLRQLNARNAAAQKAIAAYVQKNAQLSPSMFGGFMDTGARSASAALAQAYARSILGNYGWGASQFPPLLSLWNQESGWSAYAVNQSSGAYGIPQSLGHGHPYNLGDYKAQILWGLNYILGRYGSPAAAWGHEVANNWYDKGGPLPPGQHMIMNGTGGTEEVLTPAERRAFIALARGAKMSGMGNVEMLLRKLIGTVEKSAVNTGSALGGALDGTARNAAYRATYSAQ